MEQVTITKIYGNAVWVENDILGDAHVMLQSEAPGSEPACVATVRYNYPWVDNSTRNSVATEIARMFGAGENVEFRSRELPVSS